MSYLLLAAAVLIALVALAAVRLRPWLWAAAMVGSEAAGWWLGAALLGLFAADGGGIGLTTRVLFAAAAIGFGLALLRGYRAAEQVTALGAARRDTGMRWSRVAALVMPIARRPRGLQVDHAIAYGPHPRHVLDRLAPDPATGPRPAVIHIHGGGWWRGKRHTQAHPMLYRLAASGWQVITPSYRLSPEATHPDHLVDVKRVIAWVRSNAAQLGVDPGFIAIAGGSTGGNLAALAALTAGDAALQPGFEDADSAVQACIPLYGVHDLLDDSGSPLWPYLETSVIKVSPKMDGSRWDSASPIRLATDRRPPFLVIHGASDTVVPPVLSRRLVEALRAAGGAEAELLEVRWANHGFDFFAGPRGRAVAATAAAWLEKVHEEYRERVGR
jgi:acetyl esterase/lipase